MVDEDLGAKACSGCGNLAERSNPVSWSPLWRVWLCCNCRLRSTEAEARVCCDERKPKWARPEQMMQL